MSLVYCYLCNNLNGKSFACFDVEGQRVCGKHLSRLVKQLLKKQKKVIVR